MNTDFKSLVGRRVLFYGVDDTAFCVWPVGPTEGSPRLAFDADRTFGVDQSGEPRRVSITGRNFDRVPIAELTVQLDEPIDGYRLVDGAGHVWLRFGPDIWGDPYFVFDYTPPSTSFLFDYL